MYTAATYLPTKAVISKRTLYRGVNKKFLCRSLSYIVPIYLYVRVCVISELHSFEGKSNTPVHLQ